MFYDPSNKSQDFKESGKSKKYWRNAAEFGLRSEESRPDTHEKLDIIKRHWKYFIPMPLRQSDL